MHLLNDHTDVMTQHLRKQFIYLCSFGPAPEPATKLRLYHVHSGLDIAPFVVIDLFLSFPFILYSGDRLAVKLPLIVGIDPGKYNKSQG